MTGIVMVGALKSPPSTESTKLSNSSRVENEKLDEELICLLDPLLPSSVGLVIVPSKSKHDSPRISLVIQILSTKEFYDGSISPLLIAFSYFGLITIESPYTIKISLNAPSCTISTFTLCYSYILISGSANSQFEISSPKVIGGGTGASSYAKDGPFVEYSTMRLNYMSPIGSIRVAMKKIGTILPIILISLTSFIIIYLFL